MRSRTFKVWEYQVSHGQLLIRSPKSPQTEDSPEQCTNIDLVILGVEYMALPRVLRGLEVVQPLAQEVASLEAILGRELPLERVVVLLSDGKRHHLVASSFSFTENDWDIFESPFEFRSNYRGSP